MSNHITEAQRRAAIVLSFCIAALHGDRSRFVANLNSLDWPEAWPDAFRELVSFACPVHPVIQETFAEMWQGHIKGLAVHPPGGTRLRRIFANDLALFIDGLRILVPPLRGKPPRAIYRGQSVEEHAKGIIGVSWTPFPRLAEIYARNPTINQASCVVLVKFDPGDTIIGAVSKEEMIVDPRLMDRVQLIYTARRKLDEQEVNNPMRPMDLDILHRIFEEAS